VSKRPPPPNTLDHITTQEVSHHNYVCKWREIQFFRRERACHVSLLQWLRPVSSYVEIVSNTSRYRTTLYSSVINEWPWGSDPLLTWEWSRLKLSQWIGFTKARVQLQVQRCPMLKSWLMSSTSGRGEDCSVVVGGSLLPGGLNYVDEYVQFK